MNTILTEPAAAAVIVVDAADGASMSEIADASGRALSTIQRSIERLVGGGVLRRTTPRGPLVFRPDAPKRALRELAQWTLGSARTRRLAEAASGLRAARKDALPPTVKDPVVRKFLPKAIQAIVQSYHPEQVILFGSQARGNARRDSDVDLLVVFEEKVNRRKRAIEISELLRDSPFAKDVLVASATDLERPVLGTALADAAHEGLIIYER